MSSHETPEERSSLALMFHDKLNQRLCAHFEKGERANSSPSDATDKFLSQINSIIQNRLDDERFDMLALSRDMLLSRSQLYRRLKPLIRQSPAQYIKFVRLQKAKELLEQTDISIGEAAFRTGFVSQSHFTRAFQQQFGINPSEYRRNRLKPASHQKQP